LINVALQLPLFFEPTGDVFFFHFVDGFIEKRDEMARIFFSDRMQAGIGYLFTNNRVAKTA